MGSLDLPYEDVPDGPAEAMLGGAVLTSGVVYRVGLVDLEGGAQLPVLIFDFYAAATGERLAPMMLVVTAEQLAEMKTSLGAAIDRAIQISQA